MAKASAEKSKTSVSLPPFPWVTHYGYDGKSVRSARPDLEQAVIVDHGFLDESGDLVTRRARVWRAAMSKTMRALPPSGQAAFLDYIEACEGVFASGGTSDPTGGGGGCPSGKSPSLSKLIAANRLRDMHKALQGYEMVLLINPAESPRRHRRARVNYRDIVEWVAIQENSPKEILKRLNISPRNTQALEECSIAIAHAARVLAHCCGYDLQSFAKQKKCNTLQGKV
ncbi:MAG: hypothetical protein ABJL72_12240 [Roseobacter sp.]